MNKPYIVCHMMTSVDGRIDCAMTEHLPGVQEYYDTLDALDAPTRISGRVTAELEMALPGKLEAKTAEALGKEAFSKEHVDLKRACEILAAEFDVKRAAAVGGGHINAGFLAAGLLDEVSILIGAGIDGRGGMQSVFDGLPIERGVTPLKHTDRIADYGEFNIFPVFSGKPLA